MKEQNVIVSLMAIAATAVVVVTILMMPSRLPSGFLDVRHHPGQVTREQGPEAAHLNEIRSRFDQAVALLHAKQYEYAITALDRVIRLSPRLPDAHVNMGFALLGLEQYDLAVASFDRAISFNANQANAYYGIGLAWAAMGDYAGALGAMRSYLHLTKSGDTYTSKARELLAEWQKHLPRYGDEGTQAGSK